MKTLKFFLIIFFLVALSVQMAWGEPQSLQVRASKIAVQVSVPNETERDHKHLDKGPCQLPIHQTAENGRFVQSVQEVPTKKEPVAPSTLEDTDPLLTSLGMCE